MTNLLKLLVLLSVLFLSCNDRVDFSELSNKSIDNYSESLSFKEGKLNNNSKKEILSVAVEIGKKHNQWLDIYLNNNLSLTLLQSKDKEQHNERLAFFSDNISLSITQIAQNDKDVSVQNPKDVYDFVYFQTDVIFKNDYISVIESIPNPILKEQVRRLLINFESIGDSAILEYLESEKEIALKNDYSDEELLTILSAIEIGKNSYQYWTDPKKYEDWEKAFLLNGSIPTANRGGIRKVAKADIVGGVTGAVAGGINGFLAGSFAGPAGTLAGTLGGAAVGGVAMGVGASVGAAVAHWLDFL